jgi:hypothetical protein
MKKAGFSDTLLPFSQTTRHQIIQNYDINLAGSRRHVAILTTTSEIILNNQTWKTIGFVGYKQSL